VMVARERDQGRVALHSTTRGYSVVPAVLGSAQIGAWSRRLAARATRRPDLEDLLARLAERLPPQATRALGQQLDRQRPSVRPHGAC
jgi:hypothetical protein